MGQPQALMVSSPMEYRSVTRQWQPSGVRAGVREAGSPEESFLQLRGVMSR